MKNGGPGFPKIYEYHHTQGPLNIHYLKHFSTTLIHHCYGGMASEFSPAQPPAVLNHLEIKTAAADPTATFLHMPLPGANGESAKTLHEPSRELSTTLLKRARG